MPRLNVCLLTALAALLLVASPAVNPPASPPHQLTLAATDPFPPAPAELTALPPSPLLMPSFKSAAPALHYHPGIIPAMLRPADANHLPRPYLREVSLKRPWSLDGKPEPGTGLGGKLTHLTEGWGGVLPTPVLFSEGHGGQRLTTYPVGWSPRGIVRV